MLFFSLSLSLLISFTKAVDDRAQDLEELVDAVVPLGLVDVVEKDLAHRSPDKRTQAQKLAVDPVQRRLEIVSFSGVLHVKQVQELTITRDYKGIYLEKLQHTEVIKCWSINLIAVRPLNSGDSRKRWKTS